MTMILDEDLLDLADGVYAGQPTAPAMARLTVAALVASAIPVKPPREWFNDPGLTEITPLTVESSGRVFGHIAGWKQDHIGMNGHIRAPHSRSNYAFFATGCLETAEGEMVNVGQISHVGGHASLEASVAEAVAHYDNTQSGVMDVAVGEDRHGIWVAGALRPDVDELKLRRIRASGVSGDWRPINGNLELVACCSVNVPGFPIPRARVAAGVPVAMVAAGTTEIVEAMLADHADAALATEVTTAVATIDDRVRLLEDVFLDRVTERRDAMLAAVQVARDARAALRARVHAGMTAGALDAGPETVEPTDLAVATQPEPIDIEALRRRVREPLVETLTPVPPEPLLEGGTVEIDLEQLRARVRGQAAPAVPAPTAEPVPPDTALAASLRQRVRPGGSAVPFARGSESGALTAGTFTENLHPRGHDGKFIEIGGLLKLVGGKHKNERGTVESIDPGKNGGKPKIRVKLSDGGSVDVSPNDVEQAEDKGRLSRPLFNDEKADINHPVLPGDKPTAPAPKDDGPKWSYFDPSNRSGMPAMSEPQVTELPDPRSLSDEDLVRLRATEASIYWSGNPARAQAYDAALAAEQKRRKAKPALAASLRERIGTWVDGMPAEYSFADCQQASAQALQASLRSRVRGEEVVVAAPKSWSADERRKAKGKGATLPDGSFPVVSKADFYRARQSLGRAKNPAAAKRHLKRRARTLGIPAADYASL